MKTQAIILAAGSGVRFGGVVPKPLVLLNKKALFLHSLGVFAKSIWIDSILLVVEEDRVEMFQNILKSQPFEEKIQVVAGGAERYESVQCALNVLDSETEIIVVHDAARPLIRLDVLDEAVQNCLDFDGVIIATPVKATIKQADESGRFVDQTLDRTRLWDVQTPQVFKKDILIRAHQERGNFEATDDSVLVERIGGKIKIVRGDYSNIKITTQEDLVIAEELLK